MSNRRVLLTGIVGIIICMMFPTIAASAASTGKRGALVNAPTNASEMTRWRNDIDVLANNGLNLVRTGVPAWLVAPRDRVWDVDQAKFYRNALSYARSRGLAINLVVPGAPDWAQNYDTNRYSSAVTWFWTQMSDNFGDQVALWQVFNEADGSHYQHFTSVTINTQYLTKLGNLLKIAQNVFNKPVTTNVSGWPMNDQREQDWYTYLDPIYRSLDVISLDLYPADNSQQITLLPDRINRVHKRYGKPVYVAEVGLQTSPGSWTEAQQRQYLPAAINSIRRADNWGVCLYQLRDQTSPAGFGIIRSDGSHKLAFIDTMRSLS